MEEWAAVLDPANWVPLERGASGSVVATPSPSSYQGAEVDEDDVEDDDAYDPTTVAWHPAQARGIDEVVAALRDRGHRGKKKLYQAVAYVAGLRAADQLRPKRDGAPVGTGPKLSKEATQDLLAWAALAAPLPPSVPDVRAIPLRWVRAGSWPDEEAASAATGRAADLIRAAQADAGRVRAAAAAMLRAVHAAATAMTPRAARAAAAVDACRARSGWSLDADAAAALAASAAAAADRCALEAGLGAPLPTVVSAVLWACHVAMQPDYAAALVALERPRANVGALRSLRCLLGDRTKPRDGDAALETALVPAAPRERGAAEGADAEAVPHAWMKDTDPANWAVMHVAHNRHLRDPDGRAVPLAQDLAVKELYVPVPVAIAGTVTSLATFPEASFVERVGAPACRGQLEPFGALPDGFAPADAWRDAAVLATPTPNPAVFRDLVLAAHARRGDTPLKGGLSDDEWQMNDYVRLAYLWDWVHARRWFGRLPDGQHVIPALADDVNSFARKACAAAAEDDCLRVDLRELGSFVAHVLRRRLRLPESADEVVAPRARVAGALRFARRLVGCDDAAGGADPCAVNAQANVRDWLSRLGFVPFPVVGGARTRVAGPCKRVRTVHVTVNDALLVGDGSMLYGKPGFYGDAPVTTLGHVMGANPRFAHFWHAGSAPLDLGGGVVVHDALDALDRVRMLFGLSAPSTGRAAIKQVRLKMGGRAAVARGVSGVMRDTQLLFASSSAPCASVVTTREAFPFVRGHCEPLAPRAPTMVLNYKRASAAGQAFMAAMTDDMRARSCGVSRKAAPLPLPTDDDVEAARRAGTPLPLLARAEDVRRVGAFMRAHALQTLEEMYATVVVACELLPRLQLAAWERVAHNDAFAVLRRAATSPRAAATPGCAARAREQLAWDLLRAARDESAAAAALRMLPTSMVYARTARSLLVDPLRVTRDTLPALVRERAYYRCALLPDADAPLAHELAAALQPAARVSAAAHGWLLVSFGDAEFGIWRLDQLLRAAAAAAAGDPQWRFHATRVCFSPPLPDGREGSVFAAARAERASLAEAATCAVLGARPAAAATARAWRDAALRDEIAKGVRALRASDDWAGALNVDPVTLAAAQGANLGWWTTAAEMCDLLTNVARLVVARAAANVDSGAVTRDAAQALVWFVSANLNVDEARAHSRRCRGAFARVLADRCRRAQDTPPIERLPAAAAAADARTFAAVHNAAVALLQADPTAERPGAELVPACGRRVVFRRAAACRARADGGGNTQARAPHARASQGGGSVDRSPRARAPQAQLSCKRALVVPAALGLGRPLRVDTPAERAEDEANSVGRKRRRGGREADENMEEADPSRHLALLFTMRYSLRAQDDGPFMAAHPVVADNGTPELDGAGRVRVLCKPGAGAALFAPLASVTLREPDGEARERTFALSGHEVASGGGYMVYEVRGASVRVDAREDGAVEAVQLWVRPPAA